MTEPTQPNVITLSDGRSLAWEEIGDPTGRPVLALHGSPGSRYARYPEPDDLAAAGIRVLTYDRPGYGLSSEFPGRTIADAVPDIAAVLDAAGVERAAVIGSSGGGAHALAAATLLAERVTVAHSYVGVAPKFLFDGDWFEGMDERNIWRFECCSGTREQAHALMAPDMDAKIEAAKTDPLAMYADMKLPAVDRAIAEQNVATIAKTQGEAFRAGYWGFIDDFTAHVRDWGFDPRTAKAPVIIEYGLHDVNVPAGHGRWLGAHVPNISVVVNEDAGHYSPKEAQLARLKTLAAAV